MNAIKKMILNSLTVAVIGLAGLTFSPLKAEAKGHDCDKGWGLRLDCTYDKVEQLIGILGPISSLTKTLPAEVTDAAVEAVSTLRVCIDKPSAHEVEDLDEIFKDDFGWSDHRKYEIAHCGIFPCEALQDFWNAVYVSRNPSLMVDLKDDFVEAGGLSSICSTKKGSYKQVLKSDWKTSGY